MKEKLTEQQINLIIGKNIRTARLDAGLIISDLAGKLKVSTWQTAKYEKGINQVCAAKLYRIADILNVPVTDLLPPAKKPKVQEDDKKTLNLISSLEPVHKNAVLKLIRTLQR
jgi:transcriptional regulator with XRE-family HTH domain